MALFRKPYSINLNLLSGGKGPKGEAAHTEATLGPKSSSDAPSIVASEWSIDLDCSRDGPYEKNFQQIIQVFNVIHDVIFCQS